MARRTVSCPNKHTPLTPNKSRIRLNWLKTIHRNKDIISISHGILDEIQAITILKDWRGRIQLCDIEDGVYETCEYIREDSFRGKVYPDLKGRILPPGRNILDTVEQYCMRYGSKQLGAVDIDLAFLYDRSCDILLGVVDILTRYKYHGKILLTFTNQRDYAWESLRISEITRRLPKHVSLVRHEPYSSSSIKDNASRSKGSAMCIMEFKM